MEFVPISIMASLVIGDVNNDVRGISTINRFIPLYRVPPHDSRAEDADAAFYRTLKKVIHSTRPPQARQDAPLPVGYIEDAFETRTKLEAFFSIL